MSRSQSWKLFLLPLCWAALLMGSLSAAPQIPSSQTAEGAVGQIARKRVEAANRGLKYALQLEHINVPPTVASGEWIRRRAIAANDLPDLSERRAILQECVIQLKMNVEHMKQQISFGTGSHEALSSVEYNELEVELLLAKAQ